MAEVLDTQKHTDAYASHGIEAIAVDAVNSDAHRSLFKAREKIHPKRVNGTFRRVKWAVMALTLSVYYITPWLRWDRGLNAPNQAVLIDFPARRFYFFFIEIWPQEVYYITGLLILAAVSLFLWTALAGRVWCGYMCPQTVWTDLFLVVERAVEGQRNERIKLDRAPWGFGKLRKRVLKHAIWLVIALATGGAWIFYFADAPTLAKQLLAFDAPAAAYICAGILAFMTYMLGGFAREQVCTYMCPWPRIQSAMMDEHSLLITYRLDRGEPRGAHKKGEPWEGRGDCIDCKQCVAACPMGVDIREGLQLPCIQCGLCIDACDDIMTKIDRPRGLIAYDTDLNIARRQRGETPQFRLVRARTIAYGAVLVLVGAVMAFALLTRRDFDMSVLHDRDPLYVKLSDGNIRNAFTVKVVNKARTGRAETVRLEGLSGATLSGIGLIDAGDGTVHIPVDADTLQAARILVTVPRASLAGERTPIKFVDSVPDEDKSVTVDSAFFGPAP
ncbi:MAG: cytochrome c oxidase accessory protein CcoG [Rhodospirillaceae bacterium]|nr:MAG: cytochrome c oxidase accessory protein CcoG [Rhodospirillaceae bacterium]